MGLLGLWRDLRKAADSLKDIEGDARLEALAADAYACCVEWFGPPSDPGWDIQLAEGWITCCTGSRMLRAYTIVLTPEVRSDQRLLCEAIGHEVYHRITARRRSKLAPWLEEVMGCTVGLWFARRRGFGAYVTQMMEWAVAQPGRIDLVGLRRYRRPRSLLQALRRPAYPEGFSEDVRRLGIALDGLVGWQSLCRLASSRTAEEWIEALPAAEQAPVRCILDLAPYPVEVPADAEAQAAFGYALRAVGRREEALTHCRNAVELDPGYAYAWHMVGCLHWDAGRTDEAVAAWERAIEASPQHAGAAHNLGTARERAGDREGALDWYRKALEARPDNADTLYALAGTQRSLGCPGEARQTYDRMVALGGPGADWARKALAEMDEKERQDANEG